MLEVALLCLPFAPAGWRPGLGARSPPRALTLFMVRWLLFRVMFESGLVKLAAGDPHWRDFTAMEVMYETSPFPTILAYWDHHLPHAWHLVEIALTFAAELAAPLLAIFAGRRGRWFAFAVWSVFQLGIQLTGNFGWLNLASLALGLVLLDDQMLAAAAARLRLAKLFPAVRSVPSLPSAVAAPATSLALRLALWTHFALSLVLLAKSAGLRIPAALAAPVKLVSEFRSVNEYSLYATFDPVRYQVEFEGSNDAGRTWRAYAFRHLPQRPDQLAGFIAPWFARFEATLQIAAWNGKKSPVHGVVAAHLLARRPDVMALFRADPFPDRPPTIIRLRGYRLAFTDRETHRATGDYWHKEFVGDYLPALWKNERGEIAEFTFAPVDAALRAGDVPAALALLESQFALGHLDAGLRLADMFARGQGVRPDPARAFALFTDLAARGEISATHNLATCHEYGVGTPVDLARAVALYESAAARGYALSLYALGGLHAQEKISPRNDAAGLVLLLRATARATGEDPVSRFIRDDRAGHQQRLLARLPPAALTTARAEAARRR
jgi:TPR repeat protein